MEGAEVTTSNDNFWLKATNEIFQKNVEASKQMAELAKLHLVVERKDFWGIMESVFKSCGVTAPTAGDQFADLVTNAENLKAKVDALLEVARAAQNRTLLEGAEVSDTKPLVTDPDALRWAKEFCEQFPNMDLETMHAWFANAIMCGWDNAHWRMDQRKAVDDNQT